MLWSKSRLAWLILLLAFFLSTASNAAIIRVKWDSPNNGPGNDWSHAYQSVTAAIAVSAANDEIWVAGDSAHPYVERITLKLGTGLYGGFAGTETTRSERNWRENVTILDGNGGEKVVTFPQQAKTTTALDGFTVRNGSSAGIYCFNAHPTIENNTIVSVNATYGIYCYVAAPKITSNTVTGSSDYGIYCDSSHPMIVNNSISESIGSGIYCNSSSHPTITNNTISEIRGQGIFCDPGSNPPITNNSIARNGIGIYCRTAPPSIVNNTISENSTGILCTESSSPSITNNILAFNAVGIHDYDISGTPTLSNNCVYSPGGIGYSNVAPGTGDISLDPVFANQASGDLHLSHLSPCINAGLDSAVQPGWTDLDGQPRISGAHVDIGVDEYALPSIPVVTDDDAYTMSLTQLHATWISFDPVNGIAEYEYAIGTAPADSGSGYIVGWKSAGTAVQATETGLSLVPSQTYYWYVKAKNGIGKWSDGIGVSDGIVATSPVSHLGDVKSLTPDSAFTLSGLTVSASSADFAGFVYVQDSGRATGMRVNTTATINRGDTISLAGRVKRVDGEWQIDPFQPPVAATGIAPSPLLITQRGISIDPNEDLLPEMGLDPAGLLVTVSGKITRIDSPYHVIYVNDGSNLADGLGPSNSPYVGIRVSYRTMIPPAVGKRITVTGILSVEKTTLIDDAFVNGEYRFAGETLYVPVVRPRNQADIVVVL